MSVRNQYKYLDIMFVCLCSQEQERRRKAEVAAHSALNGPRVRAYEFAGPDFEVRNNSLLVSLHAELAACGDVLVTHLYLVNGNSWSWVR